MRLLTAGALLLWTSAAIAAQSGPPLGSPSSSSRPATHPSVHTPMDIRWMPAPPSLPTGAQVAILEGNPALPGPFTMRLKLPDGFRIPPHTHPGQERITVLSGTFLVGMGERFDPAQMQDLPPGSYASMTAGTPHYVMARGETVVQLNNIGPWALQYVNPADDPRAQPRN